MSLHWLDGGRTRQQPAYLQDPGETSLLDKWNRHIWLRNKGWAVRGGGNGGKQMLSVNHICFPSQSCTVGFSGRGELHGNTHQPAKRNFSLNFCETRKYAVYYGTYYSMKKWGMLCTCNLFFLFLRSFSFFDVDYFKRLYWICYNIASFLGFGLLATRYVGS